MNCTHNLMQINLEVSGDIFENLNEESLLEKDFESEMSLLGNEWRRDTFGVSEMKCQRQTAPRSWRDIAAEKKKIFYNFFAVNRLWANNNGFLPYGRIPVHVDLF